MKIPFNVKPDDFVKSSWSKNNPKTCVEVAVKSKGVAVKDSKDPEGPVLFFSNEEWEAFLKGVESGEFNVAVKTH